MNIKVLVVEPGKEPYVSELSNELKPMQELVGGYIETVTLSPDAVLICNEEGKLNGLKANRRLGGDILVGTFFISGTYGEDFISLCGYDIKKYTKLFELGNAETSISV